MVIRFPVYAPASLHPRHASASASASASTWSPSTSSPSVSPSRLRVRLRATPPPPPQLHIVDAFFLVTPDPQALPDAGSLVAEHLWSQQYLAPHVMCGSMGALDSTWDVTDLEVETKEISTPRASHGVLLRFGGPAPTRAFLTSPALVSFLAQSHLAATFSCFLLQGTVVADVMDAFRRGDTYEGGYDALLLFAGKGDDHNRDGGEDDGNGADEDPRLVEMVTTIAVIATEMGALQTVQGTPMRVDATEIDLNEELKDHHPHLGQMTVEATTWTHGVAVRFDQRAKLRDFLSCPPVQALREGGMNLPGRCVEVVCFGAATVEGQQQASPVDVKEELGGEL